MNNTLYPIHFIVISSHDNIIAAHKWTRAGISLKLFTDSMHYIDTVVYL